MGSEEEGMGKYSGSSICSQWKAVKMRFFSNLVGEEGQPAIKKAGWIPGVKDSRAY
jgi:hypothetical protein